MKEIANRLRQARLNKGLTQQQLADKMGYRSRSAICQIESDKYEISLDTAKKLAKILDVDPAWLVFGDEDIKDEINRLFDLLPVEKQEAVLQFLRSMLGDRAQA